MNTEQRTDKEEKAFDLGQMYDILQNNSEVINRTGKDIKTKQRIMGGMVVLLSGDFRQNLPMKRGSH